MGAKMRWFRQAELRQGKELAVIAAVGFVAGLVLMNMGKKALLYNTGLLSEYTLYDMKYSGVDKHAFFLYLLQKRVGTALILAVLSTTWLGLAAAWTGTAWLGVSFGMLVMASMLRYGLKGILLILAGVFPQILVYFPAALLLLQWSCEFCTAIYYPERLQEFHEMKDKSQLLRKKALRFPILIGALVFGCLLEGYINPGIIAGLLKIF